MNKKQRLINKLNEKVVWLNNKITKECEESRLLVVFLYWAFFSFVTGFSTWVGKGLVGPFSSLPCWPHFQNCKEIFPLLPQPYSYTESIFYTLLLSVIVYGAYSLYHKKYLVAYYCLFVLWLWKLFVINVSYGIGNFDYYDLVLVAGLLFFNKKIEYLRLLFVILYFLSSTVKISDGWVVGTYFSSLQNGLPLVPIFLIPIATNFVILMQIIGCWFLLSKNTTLFRFSLVFFIFFHIYSTILVGFRYPSTALFALVILFALDNTRTYLNEFKINKETRKNYLLILLFISLQFVAFIIPDNHKITLEGAKYGLYMFDANHQCISSFTITTPSSTKSFFRSSSNSNNRCDTYTEMKYLQKSCISKEIKIKWTFDHSVNGGPFYRIVNVDDVCPLSYEAFKHNTWINTESKERVAYPLKNMYDPGEIHQSLNIFNKKIENIAYTGNKSIENNDIPKKTLLQEKISFYLQELIFAYWTLWISTLLYIVTNIIKNKNEK